MKIVLPWPLRAANPNGRANPWKLAGIKKKMREDAKWAALDAMNRADWPRHKVKTAQVQAVFYHKPDGKKDPTYRRNRDRDNHAASLKAYCDGFADIGVIQNDSGFVPLPVKFEVSEDRRVEIEITVLELMPCAAPSISKTKRAKRSANSKPSSAKS